MISRPSSYPPHPPAPQTPLFLMCSVVKKFSDGVVKAVNQMRQGPPLGHGMKDTGAMTMPGAWFWAHAFA